MEKAHEDRSRDEVIQPQAKEHQGILRASGSRRHGTGSPSEFPEGIHPADTLMANFWPPENNSIVVSHLVCENFLMATLGNYSIKSKNFKKGFEQDRKIPSAIFYLPRIMRIFRAEKEPI